MPKARDAALGRGAFFMRAAQLIENLVSSST